MSKSASAGHVPVNASDLDSYQALFQEYEGELYRFVKHLCPFTAQAEDIYQETWLRAAQHIAKKREITNFKNFIFAIATNIFRDEVRKTKFRRFFLGSFETDIIEIDHERVLSQSHPDQVDLRMALKSAMQKLTEKQRIMFTLAHVQGFKVQEIGDIMNCANGTVKSTIHRAVQKLRIELKDFRTTEL